MNHYNQRKEPTFGEPSAPELDKVTVENRSEALNVVEEPKTEPAAVSLPKAKLALSLHTKTSPGHTFTPVMKRPAESAKHLSTLEEQVEQTMSNTQQPQQPPQATTKSQNGGFAFSPVVEEPESPAVDVQPAPVQPQPIEPQNAQQPEVTTSPLERVIPMATPAAAKAAVEKVPSKYRRLLIVLLILLAIIVAIILLKPKSPETVENLQQGSSLPIEFRPVDEEEAKRAEAEAKALQEAQAQQLAAQKAEQEKAQQQLEAQQKAEQEKAQAEQNIQLPSAQIAPVVAQENPAPAVQTVETPKQEVVAVKPVQLQVVKKPETSHSVIYSPETATKPVTPKPQVVKVETAKPVAPAKPEVKAAQATPKVAAKAETAKSETILASVASKTMIVPKGVSLMQVFRNHNLNISDVNAMSKVNNIVSNLKVGEKVTVRLDKNNRVTEMIIGSGGRFIRQPNGTYIYR